MRGRSLSLLLALALSSTLTLAACGDGADAPDASLDGATACVEDRDCDDGVFCNGVERCTPASAGERACAPATPPSQCDADETCDEARDTCAPTACEVPDADGDGRRALACLGDDCDDADPNAFPGNPEVCDVADHDDDCDASTFGFRDGDRDGDADAACCNAVGTPEETCGSDCDDSDPGVSSTATETCNLIDDDCDGAIDERVRQVFYLDTDGDGYGVDGMTMEACGATGSYTALLTGDCAPDDIAVHPGAAEVCDGSDEDCDTISDEGVLTTYYRDSDNDLFGDPDAPLEACAQPLGYVTDARDCDDTRMYTRPGGTEYCDGLDNDCSIDGGREPREDFDMDGFAATGLTGCTSTGVPGVLPRTDCNDTRADVRPGALPYYEVPHCAADRDPCYGVNLTFPPGGGAPAITTRWLCLPAGTVCPPYPCPAGGCEIYGSYPTGSFDYDCNMSEDRPPTTGGCPLATPGGPFCTQQSYADPSAACGSAVDHLSCGPGPMGGHYMCVTTATPARMPCR